MSSYIQAFYRKTLKQIPLIRNLVFEGKIQWRYLNGTYCRYRPPTWYAAARPEVETPNKAAVICDRFTWTNLKSSLDAVYLTPSNWREVLERERPGLLFCESAWEGLDGCWDNEILRSGEFRKDNRQVLREILTYCRAAGIPTVFWNKEDSPKFDADPRNFIDTALWFDHIFTTAAECIPKYRELGHKSVHLMMFGYLPELFSVQKPRPGKGIAVFLGSWYGKNEERCEDMRCVFDLVLAQGMELRIYDRISGQNHPERQYPEAYAPYLRPAVPYEQTGAVMNEADYVININSVKDSRTMFARRVFEAMACGRILISNESLGMRELFPEGIWFADQPFDPSNEKEIIAKNLEKLHQYTFRAQLASALDAAGIPFNL